MTWYKHGSYNAICDVCGFEYKADQLRKNWKGLFVCPSDFETRQPQDFIRARHEDTTVPWSRPEPADDELEVCYLWERSSYADLASADCATADTVTFTYPYLLALSQGTS
jgi:hypothetical protein